MLCSCLQIQCLKTAAPAPLQQCQGCSRAAALVLPTAAAAVLVNPPGWGWHCSGAANQLCPAHSCSRSSPRMELKHLCKPGSATLEFQSTAKFHSSAANRGGNSNGPYKAATQVPVLYSQVNQVLARTGGGCYRAKAAFSVSFVFGGLLDAYPHIFCPMESPTSIQSSLSKNPTDVHRNFTCRELSGLSLKSGFLDLFTLLYLLFFENVHDRNTAYKKYIFFSLERFNSDK